MRVGPYCSKMRYAPQAIKEATDFQPLFSFMFILVLIFLVTILDYYLVSREIVGGWCWKRIYV